jgi:concanavalin A-like lectin/glucanase superfamily protein/type IX secretion system substrate protein/Big-like domain-containing protein
VVRDPAALDLDRWYHVAVSFDYSTGEMILYKDGSVVDNQIVDEALRSINNSSVQVGSMAINWFWQGSLDEVRIYNQVLTAEQIAALHSTGNDIIVSEETIGLDEWSVRVTPFSAAMVGSTTTSNTLTVHSILISEITGESVAEGSTFAIFDLDPSVVDYEYGDSELSWTYSGNSELAVSIDPATHEVTITTPGENWFGSEDITFRATNPKSDFDTEEVTFTVTSVNDAPVLTTIGDQATNEDLSMNGLAIVFSDVDAADSHSISVDSDEANVTVEGLSGNTSGSTYNLVPAADWSGTAQITVTVTDDGTPAGSDTETYTLTVNAVNDAPVLTVTGDQSTNEDVSITGLTVVFSDVDPDDSHSITVVSDEANVSVENLSGDISGSTYDLVPAADWSGSASITVTVMDNGSGTLTDSETYTVTVNAVNDAPELTLVGDQHTNEDVTLGLTVDFTDSDAADVHLITVVSDNANVTVENLSGNTSGSTYNLVPAMNWIGTAGITVTVTDNGSGTLSDTETYTFEVHEINDEPVLTLSGDQSVDEDNILGLSVVFTDTEVFDTHTITVVSDEANVSVENLSGNVSGSTYDLVPVADWNGTAQITVTVTDDGPGTLSDSETFTLTVNPVNDAPVLSAIGNQLTDEDIALTGLAVVFSDLESFDTHTITVVSDEAGVTVENISGDTTNSTFDLMPAADWNGTATITVSVTDNGTGELSDSESFTLTVNPANDRPTGIDLSNMIVEERVLSGTKVGFFSTTDPDVGDTHLYSLVEGEMSNDNDAFIILGDSLFTNSEIDYEAQSTYWIRVQTNDGNGEVFSMPFVITVTDVDETSVEELRPSLSFKVYPVPAVNELTVEIDNPGNKELRLELYNNAGSLVHSEVTFTGSTLDLSSYSNGMYFLTVKGDNIHETRKVIVKD